MVYDPFTSLDQLKRDMSGCIRCPLNKTRTNIVFSDGNQNAPLCIIGEGPGKDEDEGGTPFVGKAGQFLDECLAECKMTRDHIYICNVMKCRAYDINDGSAKNRPPTDNEVERCSYWLEAQLEELQPLVILALGAVASKFVFKKDLKMTKERGIFMPTTYAKAALAGLHPAYILRQHGEEFEAARKSLVSDINSARKKVIEVKKGEQSGVIN